MPSDIQNSAPGRSSHYARWSDGRSASAQDATVTFALAGLEIMLSGTGERRSWRYDTLRSIEPVRPQSLDVLLTSVSAPGASLFVPGQTFTSELAKRGPQLTASRHRWRHAWPWLVGVAALAALIFLSEAAGFSPAHALANVLPPSWRDKLGQEAVRSMTEGKKRCTDKAGLAAMEMLTKRLSDGSGRS